MVLGYAELLLASWAHGCRCCWEVGCGGRFTRGPFPSFKCLNSSLRAKLFLSYLLSSFLSELLTNPRFPRLKKGAPVALRKWSPVVNTAFRAALEWHMRSQLNWRSPRPNRSLKGKHTTETQRRAKERKRRRLRSGMQDMGR